MRIAAFLFCLATAILAGGEAVDASVSEEAEMPCVLPHGWETVAARDPDFVVFGELHGTNEGPAFFGSVACGLARNGERLLIAIEFSSYHNAALQNAWNADEEQFEALLLNAGWRGRPDGVASQAMFQMAQRLHRLRLKGLEVDIVAFNGAKDDAQRARFADLPSQGPHEAAQAENIAQAASAVDYDRVLILVGNIHAMNQPYNFGGGSFDPMAMRLAEYGSVLSLNMKHGGGEHWSCQRDCGVHSARANASIDGQPFLSLDAKSDDWSDERFDGFYWIGPISASPPKAPDYE